MAQPLRRGLSFDMSELERYAKALPKAIRSRAPKEVEKVLQDSRKRMTEYIRTRYFSGRPHLIKRTGTMASQIHGRVTKTGGQLSLTMYMPGRMAPHIYGAVIFPKVSNYLRVPFREAYRFIPREQLHVIRVGNRLYLATNDDNTVTHILVKRVVIPKRVPVNEYIDQHVRRVVTPKVAKIYQQTGLYPERYA